MEGPDLWYQMALVDTTVEQSLVSSAEGTRGRERVWVEDGSPRGAHGWDGGMGEGTFFAFPVVIISMPEMGLGFLGAALYFVSVVL